MIKVAVGGAVVTAAVFAAAPAPASRSAACTARTLSVSFDPRSGVTVTARGRTLASATFVRRSVARGCGALVTTSPPHTPKGIYRRVSLTCSTRKPLEIEAHEIVPSGSQLIVAERGADTWLVSAVIKP